jgi:hypothetical protein
MSCKYCFPILIFLLALAGASVHAQRVSGAGGSKGIARDTLPLEVLDNAQYRVFYSLSFVNDTAASDRKTETQTLLLVGARYKGEFTFQHTITARENHRYVDKGVHLDWKLFPEGKKIQGYACQKATASYRGRKYTAWYCPEIAISEGPYVFGGLPGLILEIYDDREHYKFSLNGLHKAKGYNPIYLLSDIVNSSRDDVRKIISNLNANPASALQLLSGKVEVRGETPKNLPPRPYNPIELE